MRRIIRSGVQEWIVTSGSDGAADGALDLRDRAHARTLFARLLRDPGNARTLRTVLADAAPGIADSRVSEAELADHLASHAAAGRLRLIAPSRASNEFRTQNDQPPDDPKPQPLPPAPPPPRTMRRTTWIKFKLVDDSTGEPIPGVRLRITTPGGIENFYTTNSSGMIEIDGIEPGACEARCDLKGATLADTLSFVALEADGGNATGAADASPGPSRVRRIAEVRSHKVSKGESIDGLAKEVGLTWQGLSRFNWNTDNPNEINRHLRDTVGCTRKTKDGYNYVFDDSDDPGILLIPHPWEQTGLKTTQTHLLRVREVAVARTRILYYEDGNYILPNADYTILDDNGAIVASGVSDARARVQLPDHYQDSWPIVLGRPRRVIGTVLTAGDRKPVACQKMTVRTWTRRPQTVTSGEDGRIAILRVPEGSLSVTWQDQEAVIFVDRDIDDALFLLDAPPGTEDPEAPDEHEHYAEAKSAAVLTLDLVDPSDQPLPGVAVRVMQDGAEVFSGTADGGGRVLVTGHDPDIPCEVHVEGHGTMAVAGAHGEGHDEDGELPTYDPGEVVAGDAAGCGGEYSHA